MPACGALTTAPHIWEAALLLCPKQGTKGESLKVKLIVGLGNPGKEYDKTRHNVGFHVADLVAEAEGWAWDGKLGKTPLASGQVNGEKVVLAKPQTFMNLSGPAVAELVRWYKLDLADLLVVSDDLDLPFARMRLRPRGASGGHHGLESVIQSLGSNDFPRLKVGIGRPAVNPMQTAGYVLQAPRGKEKEVLEEAERQAADAVRCFIREGVQVAMNQFNAAKPSEKVSEKASEKA